MGDMCRNPGHGNILVGDSLADSVGFPIQTFAGAIVHVPDSETTVTTLTVYVADADSDSPTYRPLIDSEGTAVVLSVGEGNAYELPPAIFAAPLIKLVADAISGGTTIRYPLTVKS